MLFNMFTLYDVTTLKILNYLKLNICLIQKVGKEAVGACLPHR